MKHKFLFSLRAVILLLVMCLSIGNVWGTKVSADFQCSCSQAGTSPDLFSATGGATGSSYYTFKSGSKIVSDKAYTLDPSKSVSVDVYLGTYGGYSSGKNDVVFCLVDKDNNVISSTYTTNFTAKYTTAGGKKFTGTVTLNKGQDGKSVYFRFTPCSGASSTVCARFHKFDITYTAASSQADLTITPDNTKSITVEGAGLDVSTLFTFPNDYDGTASNKSYQIKSGGEYASLSGTTLTATAAGTTVITCSATATTKYKEGSADASVTVNAKACSTSITITKGTSSNGSFNLSQTGTVCIDDGNASVDVTSISPDEHYHFKEITATNGSVDNTNKKVTNISANTTINVEFEENQKHDISFVDNLQNTSSIPGTTGNKISVYDGETFTFPTIQDKTAKTTGTCEEVHYHFMGWALSTLTDPIAVDDIKTGTSAAVTAEATYKAVWAKEKTE